MPVPKVPTKKPLPEPEATPSSARLEVAVRKAASAKTKARAAKAALKKAKKSFRLARKAAKAARKEVDALRAAIPRAEEKVAAAARRARATRRAPKAKLSTVGEKTTPRPPVTPKPVRRKTRASSSTLPGADGARTGAGTNSTDTLDGSTASTSS